MIYNVIMAGDEYRHGVADAPTVSSDSVLSGSETMQKMAEEKMAEAAEAQNLVSASN